MSNKRDRDSVQNIIIVAFSVCLVCAIVVSAAAVSLRPLQQENAELDRKSNVLQAAGIFQTGVSIDEQFEDIETRVIELATGEFADHIDPDTFDQRRAARDPSQSQELRGREDIAGINRLEDYSLVYLVRDDNDDLEIVILPVRAYGLWSTMYGFLALESDLNTVAGLGFYDHAETPGLGGEIDNRNWIAQWPGRKIYNDDGEVALRVTRGGGVAEEHHVDGLSGATLTSRGVDNMIEFWMGERGFKPFLENLRGEES
ncbi:MAG: Na(+)-translocating NADH-quinone reductase subunit C [Natronospirillum sp.]|uniref:Na(+)-translocating NADH-quinone reductase subunit C n=1 Tax=Natronospirillum sp. TaxID=2812955 RepID=UPI0025F640D8|nr:Na(+)-translocating NADH-quinone reductase subunit C [Natronospirillum sp.]MCH8552885.1 Na(+)-translocating NADH-quinone reductase subunit C [Natronospirillum sp.]